MINPISKFLLHEYQVNDEGGKIYVDQKVKIWLNSFSKEESDQRSKIEEKIFKQITKSGLDENPDVSPPEFFPKISLILVLYNSKFWFENLSMMFENLKSYLYEIIIIDNGSKDDCMNLLEERFSGLMCIKNDKSNSFSTAINQGTRIASGEVFLIINPDIYIPRSSLWALIECYNKNHEVAAISPKLMLMKTPGFINGIGNVVKPFWHGYDIGLGHLDVGQFDHISELPSACFAAILIPKTSWEKVGELDEEFPMYYEDSDWCYRARGLGLKIKFCKESKIFHAFKSSSTKKSNLQINKHFYDTTYGRLRFVFKNFKKFEGLFYLTSILFNDILFILKLTFSGKKILLIDYLILWKNNFSKFEELRKSFLECKSPGIEAFNSDFPRIYNGIPVLKWKNIKSNLI